MFVIYTRGNKYSSHTEVIITTKEQEQEAIKQFDLNKLGSGLANETVWARKETTDPLVIIRTTMEIGCIRV